MTKPALLLLIFFGIWLGDAAAQQSPRFQATPAPATQEKAFTSLAEALKEPANAVRLSIYDPLVESVPTEIAKLPNLRRLSIRGTQISTLPPEIGTLQNLQVLELDLNKISVLPKEIGKLTGLQLLTLAGNRLTRLPLEIRDLTKLQVLNIGGNQLTEIPVELCSLSALDALHLNDNQIKHLPAEIGNLTALQVLDASSNRLVQLPAEIGHLTQLQVLDVHNNGLSELPDSLKRLDRLLVLHAGFNLLRKLPDQVADLPRLQMAIVDTSFFSDETEITAFCGRFRRGTIVAVTKEPYQNGRRSGVGTTTGGFPQLSPKSDRNLPPKTLTSEKQQQFGGPPSDGPGQLPGLKPRPIITGQVKPKYSETARQNYIQGKVLLSGEFRTDGRVDKLVLLQSLGFGLDEAALRAALQVTFKPATIEGEPVSTRAKIEFNFNLR